MVIPVFIVLIVGAILLFYNFATFVLPAWAGLATFIWAMGTGAGFGSLLLGLAAGSAVYLAGYIGLRAGAPWLRFLVLAIFVASAFTAGYAIVVEAGHGLVPSPVWRQVLAIVAGTITGAAGYRGLLKPLPYLFQGRQRWGA